MKLSLLLLLVLSTRAFALVIAYDDASDPAYFPGANYHSLNGGFGFAAWVNNGFPVGGNPSLHGYIGTSTLNGPGGPDIDTAGEAWGNNADPTGNTFLARRNLLNDLPVGGTYSISYDNGDVDGQETLSWGLNNNNICQFFFNPFIANYQFTDVLSSTTVVTPIPQTFGGLRLTLTRNTASTYSFQVKRLSDNFTFPLGPFAYNTSLVPGIRTINISNNDGGAGGGHAMFVNAIEATDGVPEPGSVLATFVLGASMIFRRR